MIVDVANYMPMVLMALCVLATLSPQCRATGAILSLSFAVNLFIYEDLQAFADSLINGSPNFMGPSIVITINILTILCLITASFKFKELQIIKQSLILMAFISTDILLIAGFVSDNYILNGWYNNYEYVVVLIYIIMALTIGRSAVDGIKRSLRFLSGNLSSYRHHTLLGNKIHPIMGAVRRNPKQDDQINIVVDS